MSNICGIINNNPAVSQEVLCGTEKKANLASYLQKLNPSALSRTVRILSAAAGVFIAGTVSYIALRSKNTPRPTDSSSNSTSKTLTCFKNSHIDKEIVTLFNEKISPDQPAYICTDHLGKTSIKKNLEGKATLVDFKKGITREGTFHKNVLVNGRWEEKGKETRTGKFSFKNPDQLHKGTIEVNGRKKETGNFVFTEYGHKLNGTGTLEFPGGAKVEGHFLANDLKATSDFREGFFVKGDKKIRINLDMLKNHHKQANSYSKAENEALTELDELEKKHNTYYFI